MPEGTDRRIGHGILDALRGLPLFATAPLYRHWHLQWGATDQEVQGPNVVANLALHAAGIAGILLVLLIPSLAPRLDRLLAAYRAGPA